MMTVVYIVAAVFVILIILAAVAPNTYDVSRSIVINKPLGDVFQYLKYVKNQSYWGPWGLRDPAMKQTFTGIDGTVGFISAWESDHKQVGSGEQEITRIVENAEVECELRFLKPWKSVSIGYLKLYDEGNNQTKVVWGFHGRNNIPVSIMMLFFNMDKAIGKDFEEGLANLKSILEK